MQQKFLLESYAIETPCLSLHINMAAPDWF
jgi:hypothetical protein